MGRFWKKRAPGGSRSDLLRAATLEWRKLKARDVIFEDGCATADAWALMLELYIVDASGWDWIPPGEPDGEGADLPYAAAVAHLTKVGLVRPGSRQGEAGAFALSEEGRRRVEAYLAVFCRSATQQVAAVMHAESMRVLEGRFSGEADVPGAVLEPRRA